MAKYNKVKVKLSYSQLNKLKIAVKNLTGTTLRRNIKMLDGKSSPHELLATAKQKAKFRIAFEKNMSTDIKLSKAQMSKMIQSGGFLESLLSKLAGPLMKLTVPITKKVLAPLGLTAAMSAIDGSI